jgi:carbonic anhydrase
MTDDLIQGLADFKRYQYSEENDLMQKLVEEGQSPEYFMISCIDSRANPSTIFRARPGMFFAHKAMGAIVRPYKTGTALAAALQFALNYNKVNTIIVMGHTQCGAIQALANNIEDEEISRFINVVKHAHDKAEACCTNPEDVNAQTEKEVVLESVENLKGYPSVAKALTEERVTIKPWLFDMKQGELLEYNETSKEFEIVSTEFSPEDSRCA